MEITDLIFLATWFLGGFIAGLSGMGAAMVSIPILSSFLAPNVLFPISTLISFQLSIYLSRLYFKDCLIPITKKLLIGAIPGTFFGVALLVYVPPAYIQLIAGVVMLAFVALRITSEIKKRIVPHSESLIKTLLVGFTTGTLNASISIGAPPIAAYSLYLGWTPFQSIATINVFSVLTFIVSCSIQASAGFYIKQVLILSVTGGISALIGLTVATPLAKRIPQTIFRRIVLFIIFVGGTSCIIRGIG